MMVNTKIQFFPMVLVFLPDDFKMWYHALSDYSKSQIDELWLSENSMLLINLLYMLNNEY